MDSKSIKYQTVEAYIAAFPPQVQERLQSIRAIIQKAAPKAVETISYNMPAYKQYGVLVYFAANKEHIGFYPTGSPVAVFKEQLKDYKTSKGAIQFPLTSKIPVKLVTDIVKYRIKEDAEYQALKAAKKKAK